MTTATTPTVRSDDGLTRAAPRPRSRLGTRLARHWQLYVLLLLAWLFQRAIAER